MSASALMCARRRENDPPKSSGETASPAASARRFADSPHWDNLAARYLLRYTLPGWSTPYDSVAAEAWLDRLDLPLRDWLATGNYHDLDEFARLNPEWPLRAVIGLMLELRRERGEDVE